MADSLKNYKNTLAGITTLSVIYNTRAVHPDIFVGDKQND